MLSTRSWPITGACWWWTSLPPSGALAVAVAQDMGITVGYLPKLSMRRIADLTPGSAKTDAKDAAALSMLTGFDLDLARQVNQTEGRIRGQSFPQTPPSSGCWGPGRAHDAAGTVLPHLARQLIALHAQRADDACPGRGPGG